MSHPPWAEDRQWWLWRPVQRAGRCREEHHRCLPPLFGHSAADLGEQKGAPTVFVGIFVGILLEQKNFFLVLRGIIGLVLFLV